MFAHLVAWGYANVLGNLIASILWAVPAFLWHHSRLKRHYEAEMVKLRKHVLGAIADERQRKDGDR